MIGLVEYPGWMTNKKVGSFEAKTRLSELLDQVSKGAIYIITKRGRPVAELRPPAASTGLRFGCDAGKIWMADDFDAPLPDFEEYTN